MSEDISRFAEFIKRIAYPRAFSSEDRRRRLLKGFRTETVQILLGLKNGNIIGQNTEPVEVPDQCNLCASPISFADAFVDGMTGREGRWAYMCVDCYSREGEGVGWGIGQLYAHDGERWQCIGGGDPRPVSSD